MSRSPDVPDPARMAGGVSAEVLALLERAASELEPWFEAEAALLRYRPADGGWSVAEVLEHVTLANHFLLLVIEKHASRALARAARGLVPEGESDLASLERIGQPEAFRWPHPEHMQPTGTLELEEARSRLSDQFSRAREALARLAAGEGRLATIKLDVDSLGRLDLYQWLAFLAQHALRHVEQMRGNEREQRAGQ